MTRFINCLRKTPMCDAKLSTKRSIKLPPPWFFALFLHLQRSPVALRGWCGISATLILLLTMSMVMVSVANGLTYEIMRAFNDSDGRTPVGNLVVADSTLYGSTSHGGSFNGGTVYKIGTDGNSFSVLKNLSTSNPRAGVILAGTTLYGTCGISATDWDGAIFKINVDGTSFSNIHTFYYDNGGYNTATGLAQDNSILYGATNNGGSNGDGVFFKINADGTGYLVLRSFSHSTDGYLPGASPIVSGTTLYGINWMGGQNGGGTLFKMDTDGTDFTILHNFISLPSSSGGANPSALILNDSTLYGVTYYGGNNNQGTVFKINTDGTDFTVLHTFSGGSEGARPHSNLALIDSTLYGVAYGGIDNKGILFQVGTDGGNFDVLHSFAGGVGDGSNPGGGPIAVGLTLYGCTGGGGATGNGVIYSLTVPEPSSVFLLGIAMLTVTAFYCWEGKREKGRKSLTPSNADPASGS